MGLECAQEYGLLVVFMVGRRGGGGGGGWTPEVSKLDCNLLCISCNENIDCN